MKSSLTIPAVLLVLATAGCKKEPPKPAGLPADPVAAPAAPTAPTPPPIPPSPPPAAADEVPGPPDPKTTISGTISLPKARKKDLPKEGVIFITARKADGGMMLAAQKHPIGDFPMPFTLSHRDAMIPGTPFEGIINLSVRVDKDGEALTAQKGDLLGQANGIKVGTQDVAIPLDTLQTEDKTKAGGVPRPGAGAMPPGHP